MSGFEDFNLIKQLGYAIDDLGFTEPTPIQKEAYAIIKSGKNVVGVSQTGTGKTLAFMLPVLQELKFSKQTAPRVMVLVPTRELVIQVVEHIEWFSKYISLKVVGVYGGTNINTQGQKVAQGVDILVGTPGRVYDLAMTNVLKLKTVKQLIIDEVDVMLDLGFRFQLTNIFELLPDKRQNIMFSATMTEEVDELIEDYFIAPQKIAIAVSGTPLENINQSCYPVQNFNTKINLISHIIREKTIFKKVLIFVSSKKNADRLFEGLEMRYGTELGVIHSNKSQNYRVRAVQNFDTGKNRILVATDVLARGLDLDEISHVINMDTPIFPENYMHRIGRTGRAEKTGHSILLYTPQEEESKLQIEVLMDYEIPTEEFPAEVEINPELIPEERSQAKTKKHNRNDKDLSGGGAFHEKKDKNKKSNLGGSYRRELAKKYKKPQRRGDKIQNMRSKKKVRS